MKHIATIQAEFLKEARKWDDLSYEEQKGYLSRHPKSKRRITARPSTNKPKEEAPVKAGDTVTDKVKAVTDNAEIAKINATINPYLEKLKRQHPRSEYTDRFIGKVDDILYNNAEIPRSDFGLSIGKQWGKQFVDELADAGILKIVKKDRKQYVVNPKNTTIETKPQKDKKIKFTIDSVNKKLNQLGGRLPLHGYIGSGQTELEKLSGKYAALMQIRSVLKGEKTISQIDDAPNAYYPNIMTSGRIPLSARTAYQGVIRSFKNVRKETPQQEIPKEVPKQIKTDVTKEISPKETIKEKIRKKKKDIKFPAEAVKRGLESLRLLPGAYDKDSEAMELGTDKKGNPIGYEIGFRDLGIWHSRPHEEDDDQANWDPESYKKYAGLYKEWLSRQSWYNPDTMKPHVTDGEKSWAYFGITKRDLKQEKIKRNYLKLQVQKALAQKNNKPFEKEEKLTQLGNKLSSKWAQHWVESELLKQKNDGTWKVNRKRLNQELNKFGR